MRGVLGEWSRAGSGWRIPFGVVGQALVCSPPPLYPHTRAFPHPHPLHALCYGSHRAVPLHADQALQPAPKEERQARTQAPLQAMPGAPLIQEQGDQAGGGPGEPAAAQVGREGGGGWRGEVQGPRLGAGRCGSLRLGLSHQGGEDCAQRRSWAGYREIQGGEA